MSGFPLPLQEGAIRLRNASGSGEGCSFTPFQSSSSIGAKKTATFRYMGAKAKSRGIA